MADRIDVLMIDPCALPEIVTIENSLEGMQGVVGGDIEIMGVDDNVNIVLNENGKINGEICNRPIYMNDGLADVLQGTFFIAAFDENGEGISLTDEQKQQYESMFHDPYVFMSHNGKTTPLMLTTVFGEGVETQLEQNRQKSMAKRAAESRNGISGGVNRTPEEKRQAYVNALNSVRESSEQTKHNSGSER